MDVLSSIENLVNWKLRKWHKIFIIGKKNNFYFLSIF